MKNITTMEKTAIANITTEQKSLKNITAMKNLHTKHNNRACFNFNNL